MLNALSYTAKLEEIGFERKQAETLVRMFMQMIEFNMLSRAEFERFQSETEKFKLKMIHRFEAVDARFDKVEKDMKEGFEEAKRERFLLEERLNAKLDKISLQLTVKLGVMLAFSVGLISTILSIKL